MDLGHPFMATYVDDGPKVISTGSGELDKKMGGGIPTATLTLLKWLRAWSVVGMGEQLLDDLSSAAYARPQDLECRDIPQRWLREEGGGLTSFCS